MSILSRRSFLKQSGVWAAVVVATEISVTRVAAAGDGAAPFEAGIAVRDITPPNGAPLWGYSDALRVGAGTFSPLYARAIVFQVGEQRVGVVTLDLGRMPTPDVCARIREAAKGVGLGEVMICASHTHSAPVMESSEMPYVKQMEAAIVDALREAAEKARPARIGVGRANIDIAHNRRVIKDGKCYMMWRNAERKPTSPVDPEAGVIRIDTADGRPLAVLVNYACHPVIFGPDNVEYSADWPGEMCRLVKAETGAECFFLQGGCGDINPYMDKTALGEGARDIVKAEGEKAGRAVLAAWSGIESTVPAQPAVSSVLEPVEVGVRWNLDDPKQVEILKQVYGPAYDLYMAHIGKNLAVPLGVMVLNNTLALAFMPGEMFVQFQLDLKRNSPVPDTFLCGYANAFHAYFPTIRDAAIGGYGGAAATYVGVGAGEKLTAEASIQIAKAVGKFGAISGAGDFEVLEL
ncbi:MAG: hypothetical protein GWP08_17495 [Nitrospiraceae bacterium]|nr:hypothetical protein [Nitrospiraceae bacterium]